jgi:hypothetical protein
MLAGSAVACKTEAAPSGSTEGPTAVSSAALKGDAATLCPRATREECNRWCGSTAHPHECFDICRKRCPPCADPASEWCDKQ